MKTTFLIDYRKSTKREAKRVLADLSLAMIGLIAGLACFGRIFAFSIFEFAVVGVVIATVAGIGFAYCIVNFRADSDFRCVVTCEKITCNSPALGCGESFSLKVAEVAEIEREPWGQYSERIYIRDFKGNRYWLTSNYDNPIVEILAALKSVNPKILGC